jgi:hypothetical protein
MIDADGQEPRDGSRWQWVAGAVAVVLAVAIVAGLVFVRLRTSAQPAAAGHGIGTLSMTTQLDFHCTLPVQGYLTQARVSMPDGGVTADHTLPAGKGIVNAPGSSYVGGRWLPVPLAWVSADARWYAYISSTTGVPGKAPAVNLFAHDIVGNADRQLWSGTGYAQLIGWGAGGVYFSRQGISGVPVGPPEMELWVVDPANPGGAHRLGPSTSQTAPSPGGSAPPLVQGWSRIAGGAAWTVSFGVPQIVGSGGPGVPTAPSSVVRMDLKDGSVSTWFTSPDGTGVTIVAIDQQGRPVVTVTALPVKPAQPPAGAAAVQSTPFFPPPPRVLLLTGPNETTEIAGGSDPAFRPYTAMADSHGVWFATPGSLWIYRQGTLVKVADVPAGLFPLPPTPSNMPTPPPNVAKASPPPGVPTGVTLMLAGPCR